VASGAVNRGGFGLINDLESNAVVLAREADAQLMLEGDSSKVSGRSVRYTV
jgi:hypothetical protein